MLINLFYVIYSFISMLLIIDFILLLIPKTHDWADKYFVYILPPQLILTVINLIFVLPSTK